MVKLQTLFQSVSVELTLTNILLLIFLLFTAKALLYFGSQFYQNKIMMNFVHAMRYRNNEALRTLSYKSFLKKTFGEFHRTLAEEPGHVQQAAGSYIDTLKNILVVLIYLSLSTFFDFRFTVLVIVCGGVFYCIYYFINKKIKIFSREITAITQKHSSYTAEKIYNFKYLKATGALNFFVTRMEKFDEFVYSKFYKMAQLNIFSNVIREPVLIYMICILILIQVRILGESMASMVVVLLLFYRTIGYILSVQGAWSSFLRNTGAVENMRNFEHYLAVSRESFSGERKINHIEELRLQNVSLHFDNQPVLTNINLHVPNRKILALVGESGSGKSTLVNILCGLYLPDKGKFIVNGNSVQDLDLDSFQKRIGYITQDSTIFAGTIYENVTLWQEKTPDTLNKFWLAIRSSHLEEFTNSLPEQENTILGHNGINLSGGQKQRICIARELFKEVDLLVMDEATSALDAQTESDIQKSIEEVGGKMTVIIVAHRLATIRAAHHIVLLEKGQITASGNFADLKEQSAYFAKVASLQGL
ncbi:ABC transporter ATP-binding protein [Kaistella solincola]|nr:ABC transporter ATP-binding protein [Kaistella solincola]